MIMDDDTGGKLYACDLFSPENVEMVMRVWNLCNKNKSNNYPISIGWFDLSIIRCALGLEIMGIMKKTYTPCMQHVHAKSSDETTV